MMRTPWQRLSADRPASSTVAFLLVTVVLGFLTSSTLVQFHHGWQPWPAATGGLIFPALSVILVLANPARYRVAGLPMRQWTFDHGVLVALVAVVHLGWPVWAVLRPVEVSRQVPSWAPLLSAAAIVGTVTMVIYHHRSVLTGRVIGTGHRFAGTPWYYRVFLARRGPVAWRTVYQPVGLVALGTVVVILVWQTGGANNPAPQAATSSLLFAGLLTAPVVAASRQTAVAVGMPRRGWANHAIVAIAVPLFVTGLPVAYSLAQDNSSVPVDVVRTLIYVGIAATAATVAAGFSVSVSFEDWGSAIAWVIGFGFLLAITGAFGLNPQESLWPASLGLVANSLLAWFIVSYARGKALLGQPDWTMTSIIGGGRSKYGRIGN